VAEVITQFLVQEATDKKLAAFCVVHEVIMRSKDQVSACLFEILRALSSSLPLET